MKQHIKKILKYIDKQVIKFILSLNKHRNTVSEVRPENQNKKLLIECSDTYNTMYTTGIQRVVRNIITNLQKYAKDENLELTTVYLVHGTFVKVDLADKKMKHHGNSTLADMLARICIKLEVYKRLYTQGEIKIYEEDILLMLDGFWHTDIFPGISYAKKRGAKIIAMIYDLIPISHPDYVSVGLEQKFIDFFEKSPYYVDGYIAISKTVMLDVRNYLQLKQVDTSQYFFDYFYLGSDFKGVKENASDVRIEVSSVYHSNHSVYLVVSTIEPRKNHRYLFETFKKLWDKDVDVSLVIVGRVGWKTKELLAEMKQHDAYQKKLWIFNDMDDNELYYCYRHSKALLFPSFTEGYGLPIVESLQSGLPVLASDTPIHREVGGEMIDYFDIFDPNSLEGIILKIENNETILKYNDQNTITVYTWDDSAKKLLQKIMTHFDSK